MSRVDITIDAKQPRPPSWRGSREAAVLGAAVAFACDNGLWHYVAELRGAPVQVLIGESYDAPASLIVTLRAGPRTPLGHVATRFLADGEAACARAVEMYPEILRLAEDLRAAIRGAL